MKGLKNAVNTIWPGIQQQICLWHICKNINSEIKKRWKRQPGQNLTNKASQLQDLTHELHNQEPLPAREPTREATHDQEGFRSLWKEAIYVITPDKFEEAWVQILDKFPEQESIISYIQETYLPWRHQFLNCYTRYYTNFGVRVTTRTESSHKEIKSYLFNSSADLLFLSERIQQMLTNKKRHYEA